MKEVAHKCRDGWIWKCTRTLAGTRHYHLQSIRHGSFFAGSHLPIKTIIYLLYEWVAKTPLEQAAYELSIEENTTHDFYKKFRAIAASALNALWDEQIGGEHDIVEIDECQLGRRKHHRGRIPKEIWAFGAIVRNSTPPRFFIETVRKRNKQTLVPITQRRIRAGTRIISDGWRAYEGLGSVGFIHSVVNHSVCFVDQADSSTHTQNIENLWRCLRRFLYSKGTYYRKHLEEYINEFTFRRMFVNTFEQMISTIEDML
jgi:transposase-like protein